MLTLKQVQELRERRARCEDAFQVFAEDLWEHREALLNAAEHLARTESVDALEQFAKRLGGKMQTRRAIEIVVMGVRGCSACDGTGLVEVSPEAPTGDCPRCREPGYKYRASGLDPDSQAEVNEALRCLEAMALRDWAGRVVDTWETSNANHSRSVSSGWSIFDNNPRLKAPADSRLQLFYAGEMTAEFFGDTPDAARLAAADALIADHPELLEIVGMRP